MSHRPAEPATVTIHPRLGWALLTLGVAGPLGLVGLAMSWGVGRIVTLGGGVAALLATLALTAQMCYGVCSAGAHAAFGIRLLLPERRVSAAAGGMLGAAGCIAAALGAILQLAAEALRGDVIVTTWAAQVGYLVFATLLAPVYLVVGGVLAERRVSAPALWPGRFGLAAGVVYSLAGGLEATVGWRADLDRRTALVYGVVYGLVLGGLVLALACQVIDPRAREDIGATEPVADPSQEPSS